MRFRHVFIFGGSAVVLAALYLTDPDKGVSTAMLLLALVTPLVALAFSHWSRKATHDYEEADMRKLFGKAREHPIGAGLALVALSITFSALLGLFGRAARAQPPPQAAQYLPTLASEIRLNWPGHPMPAYFGGLIEHETGPCPQAKRCWLPTARLKTAREEGAGLGQLTRAWSPDGRTRFDALAELRDRHPALAELDWASIYHRPDLQLRALVLKSRYDWQALPMIASPSARLAFTDLAYNAGRGRVSQDRRACQITPGCDPGQWWAHVEGTCTASRQPIYSGRSACDISRHHVADVHHKARKYELVLRP